jgi:hypothetical protein
MAHMQEKNRYWMVPVVPGWEYNLKYCSPGRQSIRVCREYVVDFM